MGYEPDELPTALPRDIKFGAGDRDRTGTRLLSSDFKSEASANSATPAHRHPPFKMPNYNSTVFYVCQGENLFFFCRGKGIKRKTVHRSSDCGAPICQRGLGQSYTNLTCYLLKNVRTWVPMVSNKIWAR